MVLCFITIYQSNFFFLFYADIELISLEDWKASKNREADSERWLLIQQRISDSDGPFEANGWEGYKNGFGSEDGDYWIGLETLHDITSEGSWEIYFSFHSTSGVAVFTCNNFGVESKWNYYALKIGSCGNLRGSPGFDSFPDTMAEMNGALFTTNDKDNDNWDVSDANCAVKYHGGFWYKTPNSDCIGAWYPPTGYHWGQAKMAIRPA